jgi:hypothetical protein
MYNQLEGPFAPLPRDLNWIFEVAKNTPIQYGKADKGWINVKRRLEKFDLSFFGENYEKDHLWEHSDLESKWVALWVW